MINKLKLINRKNNNLLYSVVSFAALAAVNYTIIHNPIIFVFLLVLLSHELGHYFFAKRYTKDVSLPFFLPIPFVAIAFTKIKNLTLKAKKKVALAGPLVGVITSILIILFNSVFNIFPYPPLFFLLFGEIIFNWFGSDGAKYRNAVRSMQCTC